MEQKSYFTLDEAQRQLPWLKEQVQRIIAARGDLARLRGELQSTLRLGRGNGHTGVDQQVTAKRREIESRADALARLMQDVADRGIILRDPDRGLVDFPSLREGRKVYLCWLMGEDRIGFWHGMDTGFAGRQPL